jgi:hypothetical protein
MQTGEDILNAGQRASGRAKGDPSESSHGGEYIHKQLTNFSVSTVV